MGFCIPWCRIHVLQYHRSRHIWVHLAIYLSFCTISFCFSAANRRLWFYFNFISLDVFHIKIKYIHSSNTSINTSTMHPLGYMFRPNRAIIRPHIWTGSFDYSTFWDPKMSYKGGIVMLCAKWYIKVKTYVKKRNVNQENYVG